MTVRPYQSSDLDAVMTLWLEGNLDAHPFIPRSYWEGSFAAVREQIPQAEVFVAEEGGRLLGFLGLAGDYIAGIFVARAVRSQGVGHVLLEEAKRQHTGLRLHVYRKNRQALAFYLRGGFRTGAVQADPATGEEELSLYWGQV